MIVDLAGEVFYQAENRGVLAVVHSAVRVNSDRMFQILGSEKLENGPAGPDAIMRVIGHLDKPIFTFSGEEVERVKRPWLTGSMAMGLVLIQHIQEQGGEVIGQNFAVPFSYGFEIGKPSYEISEELLEERQLAELRFVTSEEQFLRTFGISTIKIRRLIPED